MAGATQRGYKAGLAMGKSIIEIVHLMYQNNTAAYFYDGLSESILQEMRERGLFNGNKTEKKAQGTKRENWRRKAAQQRAKRNGLG